MSVWVHGADADSAPFCLLSWASWQRRRYAQPRQVRWRACALFPSGSQKTWRVAHLCCQDLPSGLCRFLAQALVSDAAIKFPSARDPSRGMDLGDMPDWASLLFVAFDPHFASLEATTSLALFTTLQDCEGASVSLRLPRAAHGDDSS